MTDIWLDTDCLVRYIEADGYIPRRRRGVHALVEPFAWVAAALVLIAGAVSAALLGR